MPRLIPPVRLRFDLLEDRTAPAVFTVSNLDDSGPGSLRDAIAQANISSSDDVIVFAPDIRGGTINLTTFTNPAASTEAVPQPVGPTALVITSTITIQGTGESITRVGDAAFRLFQVTGSGHLILQNLTLSNGLAQGGAGETGGGGAGLGGAIYNQGRVTISGSTLVGNQAIGGASTGGAGGGGGLGGPGVNSTGGPPNGGLVTADGGFGGGGGEGMMNSDAGDGGFGGGGGGGNGRSVGGMGGFGGGGGVGGVYLDSIIGKLIGRPGGAGGFGGGSGSDGSWLVKPTAGAGGGMGGAVFNQGGTVVLVNSTLTANTARGGAPSGSGYGGGLFNLNGSITLTNVTIAGNIVATTAGDAAGGALYNLSLDVPAFPGGPPVTPSLKAVVTAANSILAGSLGGTDLFNHRVHGTATVTASSPNIVTTSANVGGSFTGVPFTAADPLLGPLRDNGGPTQTMALLAGSPARDAGVSSVTGLPSTDQRGEGFPRVANGQVDLGAFEVREFEIRGNTPPDGRVGVAYRWGLSVFTPSSPYTFGVTAGELPPGLTLTQISQINHELVGTPTSAGTFNFTLTATVETGESDSWMFTLVIEPAPAPPRSVLVGGRPDGTALVLDPAGGQFSPGATLTFFPGYTGPVRTAVADVTGDGVPDFVGGAGPGGGPRVVVLDGATGGVVADFFAFEPTFTGGVFVAAADLTGDGFAEIVVTPDRGGGPVVAVFDRTGATLARFLGIDDPAFRGGARTALGDINGNGVPDLVVSAGFGGGPRIALFDGATLLGVPVKLVPDFFAFEDSLRNGAFVAAGDVDGDGRADVAFGGGPGGAPRVRVFSGAGLLVAGPFTNLDEVPAVRLADFFAGDASLRGGVRVALTDADGDGRADLVTGSGESEPSRVRVYGSATLLTSGTDPGQELDPFGATTLADGVFVG
jgi:hypothetical protein